MTLFEEARVLRREAQQLRAEFQMQTQRHRKVAQSLAFTTRSLHRTLADSARAATGREDGSNKEFVPPQRDIHDSNRERSQL